MEIDEGNKQVKYIKKYIKNNFVKCSSSLYKYIINNAEVILETKKINANIINDTKKHDIFLKFNNKRLEDNNIIDPHASIIIKILKNYINQINSPKISTVNSFDYYYVNVDEFTEEYYDDNHNLLEDLNVVVPNSNTSYLDVLRNLFYNNDVNYAFNKYIDRVSNYRDADEEIKTITLKIKSKSEDVDIPTKYKWICRAQTQYGECGNIIEFFQGHTHNNITCTLGKNNSKKSIGHTIKDIKNIPPSKLRRLYSYYAVPNIELQNSDSDSDSDSKSELLIYSLLPINKEIVDCNYLYITDNSRPFLLILGHKYVDDDKNIKDLEITTKNDKYLFFIQNIFEDIKKYYKKYHNINLTNQNKYVSYIILMQIIFKLFLNKRYHSMIIGKSGSGKTFIGNMLIKLFTMNYKVVIGTSITKNRFIGGRSNIISMFKNSLYEPGLIETKDLLVIDECTEPLDNMNNPNMPLQDNFYSWIKMIDQGNVDRAIQGSRECKPNASLILFGNTEQLKNNRSKYISGLRKNYVRNTNGETLNNLTTIFKPAEYYSATLLNDNLAEAHAFLRDEKYKHEHYITGLPEAEMSRFTFFICLEDDENGYTVKKNSGDVNNKYNVHRENFMIELFKKFDFDTSKKIPDKFKKDIWDYMNYYMEHERNNYRFTKERDVNHHVFNNTTNMITDLLFLNKKYYNLPLEFTETDKDIIQYVLKFNYNTLSKNECDMTKHPYINDIYFNIDNIRQDVEDAKTEFKKKLLESKKKTEVIKIVDNKINSEDLNDIE